MRRLNLAFITTAVVLLGISSARAQTQGTSAVAITINSIAALKISGGNISLIIQAPVAGGQTPLDATDNTCYLQYTSAAPTGQSRQITAAWGGSDAAPAGCSLKLQATPSGGAGEGSGAGEITVSSTAQNVITGITRCATGTGSTNGAQLTYTLLVVTTTSLVAGESRSATIAFTLTDAS
jgi:hypothetical protein